MGDPMDNGAGNEPDEPFSTDSSGQQQADSASTSTQNNLPNLQPQDETVATQDQNQPEQPGNESSFKEESQNQLQRGLAEPARAEVPSVVVPVEANTDNKLESSGDNDEPNTSSLHIPSQNHNFGTPLKSLPPLKDIDQISTPKSFNVAKDLEPVDQSNVASSPILPKNGIEGNISSLGAFDSSSNDVINAVAGFLQVDVSVINGLNQRVLESIAEKSTQFHDLSSQNSFLQLQTEQNVQQSTKIIDELNSRLRKAESFSSKLADEKEAWESETNHQKHQIHELTESNKILSDRIERLKEAEETINHENKSIEETYESKINRLNESINQLTSSNIEQSKKLNEITKEINETRNENFLLKLDLTKINNEASYLKNQKAWFEEELESVQKRYTDLIKKHETEYHLTSNKVSTLTSKNESLEQINAQSKTTIAELRKKLEEESAKVSSLKTEFNLEKSSLMQQIQNQQDLLNLTQTQGNQRATRIQQLEEYTEELKQKLGDTITNLEESLSTKTEQLVEVQEKLRRTEEVLDAELQKESELPKLTDSSSLIASSSNGISLSTLYSEFNHLKKQLVLERSQKEQLVVQLESFVSELESKKPAISNYRDQVRFYENSLKEMIGKVENIQAEKTNIEKDSNRLKIRLAENENDLNSMKKLLKDLGRQLCYYLIHSKIRDNNEDPLSLSEKQAIENILEKSGNFQDVDGEENESDQLITERLLEFKNIIELRQQNEELLRVIRILTKKLESKEEENNNVESVAIEEAKDAILTLEGELESITIKLDAITKERDILKSLNDRGSGNSNRISNGNGNNYLAEINQDLKNKLRELEQALKENQAESNKVSNDLNNKLRATSNEKSELCLQLTSTKHSLELTETRLENSQNTIQDLSKEISQINENLLFWKNQTSKQEELLIAKCNEYRDLESVVTKNKILINNLETEKRYTDSIIKSLRSETEQLKTDKNNLSEFVANLQAILKERDESSKELTTRLNKSIENYQNLYSKLEEKDERINILTNQAELTLKSQNSKLGQVEEISQMLLTTKTKLIEKDTQVESLKAKIQELNAQLVKRPSEITGSSGSDDSEKQGLRIEINQLKEDLKISEGQVEELSNLAKASEEALVNATNSFEKYKSEFDEKYQISIKEQENLNKEVVRLTTSLKESTDELVSVRDQYRIETNELKTKLDEYINKSNAYDNLQADYENRIKGIKYDLEMQVQLVSSNQTKYQAELQRNQELSLVIANYEEEVETYKTKIQDLNSQLEQALGAQESFNLERSSIEDELREARNKLEEVKQQNSIILNQLDLSRSEHASAKQSQDEDASMEDPENSLKEVVSYLRREKEAVEVKLSIKNNENDALNQEIAKLKDSLSRSKAESSVLNKSVGFNLESSIKETQRIEEQLQQLNILRESNTTLRNENKSKLQKISELEAQLQTLSTDIEPLKARVNELSTELEISAQSVKLTEEESERLKSRLAQAEQQLQAQQQSQQQAQQQAQQPGTTPSQESAETVGTRGESHVETVDRNAEIQAMKEKYNNLRNQANTRIQSQNDKIKGLQDNISSLNEEISKLKKENEQQLKKLTDEKNDLLNQIKTLKEKGGEENFAEELKKLRANFDKEKQQLQKNLQQQFDQRIKSEKSSQANEIRKQVEAEFNKKFEELEKSVEERKKTLEEEAKTQTDSKDNDKNIEDLKAGFNKELEEEKAKVKKQVEKLFEVKLKMLNKKVERLEREVSNKNDNAEVSTQGNQNSGVNAEKPVSGGGFGGGLAINKAQPAAALPQIPPAAFGASNANPNKRVGSPFTESTLTVHRPATDTPQAKNGAAESNENKRRLPQLEAVSKKQKEDK